MIIFLILILLILVILVYNIAFLFKKKSNIFNYLNTNKYIDIYKKQYPDDKSANYNFGKKINNTTYIYYGIIIGLLILAIMLLLTNNSILCLILLFIYIGHIIFLPMYDTQNIYIQIIDQYIYSFKKNIWPLFKYDFSKQSS